MSGEGPSLGDVLGDTSAGAHELAERALLRIYRVASTAPAATGLELLGAFVEEATRIVEAHPAMPQLFHVLDRFLVKAEHDRAAARDLSAFRRRTTEQIDGVQGLLRRATDRIVAHALREMGEGDAVFTVSRSSTVEALLLEAHAAGKAGALAVTASGPGMEGRKLANATRKAGLPTTVVEDDKVADGARDADRVVVGADAVTPDAFVNKVGTRAACEAASESGVPVMVLAETTKQWPWIEAPDSAALGVLFETVPWSVVTKLVDEDGARRPTRQHAPAEGARSKAFRVVFADRLAGGLGAP